MIAVDPTMQLKRVSATIWMIVATPRPGSPTRHANAFSNSISDDALERLPSLSFRRWMKIALRVPSGLNRGSRKHVKPPSRYASVRKPSLIGAEQNHLWPVNAKHSAPPTDSLSGVARLVFARTSVPPCFSVMAMPIVRPVFSKYGREEPS